TPTPSSAPRSSTTAGTRWPRPRSGWSGRGSRSAPPRHLLLRRLLAFLALGLRGLRLLLKDSVLRRARPRSQRIERLVGGEEELLAVRDHRVVGAIGVLEHAVPVAYVEPVGRGGLQVRDVRGVADQARRAGDRAQVRDAPALVAVARIERVERAVIGAEVD